MRTRILSTLLALCTVLALLPGTALALQSGKCGNAATWVLDGDTLTISGTGETQNYWSFYDLPWHNRNADIKKIVVKNGITKISAGLFRGSGNATDVTIPKSVTSIGENAFRDCDKIQTIAYNGTVSNWNEIDIHSSNLGWMFSNTSEINYTGSSGGVIISGRCGDLARWTLSSAGVLTISGKGETWNYWSFYDLPWRNRNADIKKIVVKDDITRINAGLFRGSGNATSVTIPTGVTYIGENAFRDCGKIQTISYSGNVSGWNEIDIHSSNLDWMFSNISEIAYAGSPGSAIISGRCGDLARWTLSSAGVLTISGKGETWNYWSFYDLPWRNRNADIKKIVVKDDITRINAGLFRGSGNATSVTIPTGVTYIGENAFRDCGKLEKIYYAGTLVQWGEIDIHSSNNNYLSGANTDLIPNASAPASKYTVTLRPNGGTVSKTSITVSENGKYTGLPTPTRSGYTFAGWFTADTGGTKVTASSTILSNSDHFLYAQWTKNPAATTYTITLNANSGKVSPSSIKVTSGKTYLSSLPTPTRSGYKFDGWYTSRTGGTKITSTTKATGNRTIYAHWTKTTASSSKTHMVTFDANGGTVHQDRKIVFNGAHYRDLPTPTRSGYHFQGWYTQKTGGSKVTEKSRVNLTADQTLYARWQNSATVRDRDSDTYEVLVPASYELALYTSNTTATISRVKQTSGYLTIDCTQKAELSNGTVRYYGKVDGRSYWFTYSCEMEVD